MTADHTILGTALQWCRDGLDSSVQSLIFVGQIHHTSALHKQGPEAAEPVRSYSMYSTCVGGGYYLRIFAGAPHPLHPLTAVIPSSLQQENIWGLW